MRDLLTVLAGLLIVVLAAALVVPPFVDWGSQRAAIEEALSRATGTGVRTQGDLSVRLLPSPRIAFDRISIGGTAPAAASLTADGVTVELALMPLLSGEIRFTETRIGWAEMRVPAVSPETWRLPEGLARDGRRRGWMLDDVAIGRLIVNAVNPVSGRVDQYAAEQVRLQGASLAGPWRMEGVAGGSPFRVVTGELSGEGVLQVKLSGGGDSQPRYEIDGRVALGGAESGLSGTARVTFGPPVQAATSGIPVPIVVQTSFKASGETLLLDPIAVDAGDGAASIRLSGTGQLRLDKPQLALALEGRRFDADALLASETGRALVADASSWQPPNFAMPISLDLSLQNLALAGDEITDISAKLTLAGGRVGASAAAFTAPGQTRVTLSGPPQQIAAGATRGRVAITSQQADRFARFATRLGYGGAWTAMIAPARRFEFAADLAIDEGGAAADNVRLVVADAAATGSARYRAARDGERAKLDAAIRLDGFDLARLPPVGSVTQSLGGTDLSATIEAHNVRYGESRAGRIEAQLASDGKTLAIQRLDVADLAGASAQITGRIAPGGGGEIAGRLRAARAAPLIDLFGTVAAGGIVKFVPPVLREGPLDLEIAAEQAGPAGAQGTARIRSTAKGNVAGGRFDAEIVTAGGSTESMTIALTSEDVRTLLRQPGAAALARPGSVTLKGSRISPSRYAVTLTADLAGLRVTTTRPFALGLDDESVDSGEADLTVGDARPFLPLLGFAPQTGGAPMHAQLRVTLGREEQRVTLAAGGRVAGASVQARLSAAGRQDLRGTVILDRLSLPWIADMFALGSADGAPPPGSSWSASPFGEVLRPATGEVAIEARSLDLGAGREAADARFRLALTSDGIAVRDLQAAFAGGRIAASFGIARAGARATLTGEGSLAGVNLAALTGLSPFEGSVDATMKLAGAGENPAALIANLSGSGEWRFSDLYIAAADPGALTRIAARALADEDPLVSSRLDAFAREEFDRGPLQSTIGSTSATIVSGVLRLGPLTAESPAGPSGGAWKGTVTLDLRSGAFEAKGLVTSRQLARGWSGPAPSIGLAWIGRLDRPSREIDVGPFSTGLAAVILKREVDRIEAMEADQHERLRLHNQQEMERARERDRRAAEEAQRQARLRAEEAERARLRAEEAERQAKQRSEREQTEREEAPRLRFWPFDTRPAAPAAPLDIRPRSQEQPGG